MVARTRSGKRKRSVVSNDDGEEYTYDLGYHSWVAAVLPLKICLACSIAWVCLQLLHRKSHTQLHSFDDGKSFWTELP